MEDIDGEIIVVDNASVDRTPQLVVDHFPSVTLISNDHNVGFAKANNQGISISKGEYTVLLNPDTVVSEDTFSTCLSFMDNHPEAGAVGVRMIDGSGRFLPESKRGLPTLNATFMKMTGLYKLFPGSSFMNSYYMGNIGEFETAQIEVLCGAFMFIRKSILNKIGLLDENFFMYGEDIDLSYRITEAGSSIYYLPTSNIIHYKGESTRKSSLNYILTFYQAMLVFTNKHPQFSGQQYLIKLAIYLHGFVQFIKQTFKKWWPPILDAILISFSFYLSSYLWANYYYHKPDYFHSSFYLINVPLYTLIAITALFLNGAYDKPYNTKSSWLGFGWAIISILVIYAFLPSDMRTSRMVIVMGSIIYMIMLVFSRWKLPPWNISSKNNYQKDEHRAIIIAGNEESSRIKELINRSRDQIEIVGIVSPDPESHQPEVLGTLSQLSDIVRVHRIKEIIFSAQDVPFSKFSAEMTSLGPTIRYMLAASATMNIVGSMNRDTEGESYAIRVNFKLSHRASLRAKRLFDLASSVLLLIASPLLYFLIASKKYLWSNILNVMTGKYTWIGYDPADPVSASLPVLRPGVFSPVYPQDEMSSSKRVEYLHYVYARDYHWTTDLSLMIVQWRKLGQKPLLHAN
jgi:O-antigen biosynthesis protein